MTERPAGISMRKYLKELRDFFEDGLINEHEYSLAKAKALGLQGWDAGSRDQLQPYLEKHFRAAFNRKQETLLRKAAAPERHGPLLPGSGTIASIGKHFSLRGLDCPTRQLQAFLEEMEIHAANPKAVDKYETTLHLLRIVATPGLGKSTALRVLWTKVLERMESRLTKEGHESKSALLERLQNSFKGRHLAFTNSLNKHGLNTWHDLEDRKINFALAMRMLYACTDHTDLQKTYSNFLEVHASALQKSQLTAYDVLVFIASSCGISKVQPCCISFGFDEVNNVLYNKKQDVSWVKRLFSEFVQLRRFMAGQAADGGWQILPVLVLASTRAALANLEGTTSGGAKVGDIALKPLSIQGMQNILEDLHARIDAPQKPHALHWKEQLKLALTWLSGNPRYLAWLLSSLSGQGACFLDQGTMNIGKPPLAWLSRSFNTATLLGDLVEMAQQSWLTWLRSDSGLEKALAVIFTYAFLEIRVARKDSVPGTNWQWELLEADGMIQLIAAGSLMQRSPSSSTLAPSTSSRLGSRPSSVSTGRPSLASKTAQRPQRAAGPPGWLNAEYYTDVPDTEDIEAEFMDIEDRAESSLGGSDYQPASEAHYALDEEEDGAGYDSARRAGYFRPDYRPDQVVRLPNLLAAAASRQLRVQMQRLVPGPLFSFMNDSWRSRERSDLQIFMLRLQLCRQVLRRDSIALRELFSGFEGSEYASVEVEVPASGYQLIELREQLTSESFEASLRTKSADQWAFLGPGNSGPDGWLTLQICGGPMKPEQYFVLWFQSKKRIAQPPPVLTEACIEQERSKAYRVPRHLAKGSMLFVTDQEARDLPMVVETLSGETILVDHSRQHQYYSAVSFMKVALLKASAQRKDWCDHLRPDF